MVKIRRILALVLAGLVVGIIIFPTTALAAFGIDPGKVYVDNLSPGAEGDFTVTVYNQNNSEAAYSITPRSPDYTATGYEVLPYLSWITVTPDRVTIEPQGKSTVQVVVLMPKDSDYAGKKAEAWLSFKEKGATGMVQIELASRIFISTRGVPNSQPAVIPTNVAVGISAETGLQPTAQNPIPSTTAFSGPLIGATVGAIIIIAGIILFIFLRKKQHI